MKRAAAMTIAANPAVLSFNLKLEAAPVAIEVVEDEGADEVDELVAVEPSDEVSDVTVVNPELVDEASEPELEDDSDPLVDEAVIGSVVVITVESVVIVLTVSVG